MHPFVKSYCFECHSGAKPKGDFDLSSYSTAEAAAKDYRRWELMAERLDAKEMPPDEAKRHPAAAESRLVIDWIQSVRRYEAKKNAGDPGPVFARRLSNAEYDYTIRDLIGVDLRPAQHFPIDPANRGGLRQFERIAHDDSQPGEKISRKPPGLSPITWCSRPTDSSLRRTRLWPTPIATNTASTGLSIFISVNAPIMPNTSKPRGGTRIGRRLAGRGRR